MDNDNGSLINRDTRTIQSVLVCTPPRAGHSFCLTMRMSVGKADSLIMILFRIQKMLPPTVEEPPTFRFLPGCFLTFVRSIYFRGIVDLRQHQPTKAHYYHIEINGLS
jgi:hypothetical protein